MTITTKSNWLERIYASALYRVITVVGVGIALVTAPMAFPPVQDAIFPKSPQITLRIEREYAAFDIERKFAGLTVLYKGNNLAESKSNLLVSQIRIENTGSTSISETNISRSDPLGVEVIGGKIVGMISSSANSDHLRRRARPNIAGNRIGLNPNIILDPQDHVSFDILIMKSDDEKISYRPLGKVEGVRSIAVERFSGNPDEPSPLIKSVSGNALIQTIRLIVYTAFALIIAVFVVGVFAQVTEIRERFRKRKRKKACSKIRQFNSVISHEDWSLISALYTQYGLDGLQALRELISGDDSYKTIAPVIDAPAIKHDETIPAYLSRAFRPKLYFWRLPPYIENVARMAGIDISEAEYQVSLLAAIDRFETSLDEVALDLGVTRKKLDGPTDYGVHISNELTLPTATSQIQNARKNSSRERS